MIASLSYSGMSSGPIKQPVLEKLRIENVEVVFIPANCTSELQPLDLSVNKPMKDHLKTKFTQWYVYTCMPISFIFSW